MTNQETEIVSGTGRLLAFFFGVVVMCAIFFGLGYRLGKSSSPPVSPVAEVNPAAVDSPVTKPAAAQATTAPDCTKPSDNCPSPTTSAPAPAPVRDATPARPSPAIPALSKTTIPSGYIVQVAAVSKQQDAEALLTALRRKQYPVFITTPPSDSLFHVQVGPFGQSKEAEAVRSRLVADGYNPIIKK
jgi:cell division septation protein DedD